MARGFAVLDVETTGLSAEGKDRIIEIAVIRTDEMGTVVSEWCTLVNPARDVGPRHIHGITAADVRSAPPFGDIAGDVAEQLVGSVMVAHNLSFDRRFLQAEFARIGTAFPLTSAPGLCTMRLSKQYIAPPRGTLAACCATVGIPLTAAHSALHDARAAAGLLRHLLTASGHCFRTLLDEAASWSWPMLPPPSRRMSHRVNHGHLACSCDQPWRA
ncbi:MAG: 3'-5' exonuclease, partial [Kutzneria sp.]|nr:3'-5' exonuclease [Kutzneria sp.]